MKARVLLVDDARFMRLILRQILEEAGYQVVGEACNGKEAVEEYKDKKPDLVTMDVIMPEMSGVEAARKIIKASPEAKILMVSAMGQQQLVKESLEAGAYDYVVKPFVPEDVLDKVKQALSSYTISK